MNRLFPAVIIGILLSPTLLFAQPPGRGGAPPTDMIVQVFTQADANSDGVVTRAELTAVLQNQGRGNQRGRGGPPPQGDNFGQADRQANQRPPQGNRGDHGPPPQPGQVLPENVTESLNLTAKQTRMLKILQADVDKRLAAILTDEQEEQLKNAHPPHGPDEGGEGRPQRPQ